MLSLPLYIVAKDTPTAVNMRASLTIYTGVTHTNTHTHTHAHTHIRGVSRNPGRGVLTRMLSMNGVWSWGVFAKVGLRPTI